MFSLFWASIATQNHPSQQLLMHLFINFIQFSIFQPTSVKLTAGERKKKSKVKNNNDDHRTLTHDKHHTNQYRKTERKKIKEMGK